MNREDYGEGWADPSWHNQYVTKELCHKTPKVSQSVKARGPDGIKTRALFQVAVIIFCWIIDERSFSLSKRNEFLKKQSLL